VVADGMHHNTRTTIDPDDEALLIWRVPFHATLLDGGGAEGEARGGSVESAEYLNMALAFLEVMDHLALVFLRDAAVMLVLHPERKEIVIYKHIGILKSNSFALYVEKM
jgi:hypothetical protein